MTRACIASWAVVGNILLVPSGAFSAEESVAFLRGDTNADGKVSMADALMLGRYMFNGQRPPQCLAAGDINDDGSVDLTDEVRIIYVLFLNGPEIALPFPSVGPDPTPGGDIPCESYDVVPPEPTDDILRVGDVQASPGESVQIPVFLTSSVEVEGWQFVMRYDPSALTVSKGFNFRGKGISFVGTPWEVYGSVAYDSVRAYPDRGYLVVSVLGSFDGRYCADKGQLCDRNGDASLPFSPIPPGQDQLIFNIIGTVSAEAQPGTSIELDPWDGPDGLGVEPPFFIRNEIAHEGEARYVTFFPRLQGGRLFIVGDVTFFSRGDANSDTVVDLGDAVFVLNNLFLGGEKPSCPDAADADDNGAVELTDAVVILGHLFLGEAAIAGPYPQPGRDSTSDSLAPCRPVETN